MSTPPTGRAATRRRAAQTMLVAATIAGGAVLGEPAAATAAAAQPHVTIVDRTLVIDGTDAADTIAVRLSANNSRRVEVDIDDDAATANVTFRRSMFDRIAVHLVAGDDRFRIDDANGVFTDEEVTTVDGGEGADQLSGGGGAESFIAGGADDHVDGGRANDVASLGDGNDTFRWDPGDGNDVVEGQAGFDTTAFNGSPSDERFAASANGPRLRLTRDLGRILMDLDGVERVDLAALDGRDTLLVDDVTGTALQELRADLGVGQGTDEADTAIDVVTLVGTPSADFVDVLQSGETVFVLGASAFVSLTGAASNDALHVLGRAGNDRVNASSLRAESIALSANGDDGNDQLTGGAGRDSLNGGNGADFVDGNRAVDSVVLGSGNDIFVADSGDGNDIVSGGDGADAVRLSGSSANERFGIGADGFGGAILRRDVDELAISLDRVESASVLSFGGSDTLAIDDLSDPLGTGLERIDASLFDFAVPGGNVDVVQLTGSAQTDNVVASTANGVATVTGLPATLTLTGTDASGDRLEIASRGGNDKINTRGVEPNEIRVFTDGGAGDDRILGGAGDDVLTGSDGADVVFAGGGDNVAFGSGGDDVLQAEQGDDVLDGGSGDDILIGGAGDDVLLNGELIFDD